MNNVKNEEDERRGRIKDAMQRFSERQKQKKRQRGGAVKSYRAAGKITGLA